MNAITFPQLFKKNFNNYEIQLSFQQDLIIISIHEINSFILYKSDFKMEFLVSFKLFSSYLTLNQIIESICLLIEQKNYDSNLTSLEDSFDNNIKEINLINKETIKTPKKNEDKFQITTKNIFSNLFKEIQNFNEKNKI